MDTTISTAMAPVADPDFGDGERVALVGFLAGYRGLTRDACATRPRACGSITVQAVPTADLRLDRSATSRRAMPSAHPLLVVEEVGDDGGAVIGLVEEQQVPCARDQFELCRRDPAGQ